MIYRDQYETFDAINILIQTKRKYKMFHFLVLWGSKKIDCLEGSQPSAACPSDSSSMKITTLELQKQWLQIRAAEF